MTNSDLDPLWSIEDVSAYLGVPVNTLYQWRTRDYGPKGGRVGRYIRYRASEVVAWYDSIRDAA